MVSVPCTQCKGDGRVRETRKLAVKIPAGIDDGSQIRLSGEGEAGPRGTPSGDLYIEVNVRPHKLFKREGNDILLDLNLNVAQAALGADIQVPTVDGETTELKVPPGTQSEKSFRLKGKGVRNVRSGHLGDLYVRVSIETPVNLTAEQRELLRQFDESLRSGGAKHSPRENTWLDKIKAFFAPT